MKKRKATDERYTMTKQNKKNQKPFGVCLSQWKQTRQAFSNMRER